MYTFSNEKMLLLFCFFTEVWDLHCFRCQSSATASWGMLTINLPRNYESGLPVFEHYPKWLCATSLNGSLSKKESTRLNDLFFCLPNWKWSRESVKRLQTCSTFHLFSAQSLPGRVVTQFFITSPITELISGPTVKRIHRTLAIPHVKKHAVIRWLKRFLQVRFWCRNVITRRDRHEKQMNDYSVAAKNMSFVSSLSKTCHWWCSGIDSPIAVIHHVLMMLRNSLITPKWPTGQTEMIRFGCDHRGPWVAQ